MMPTNQPSLYLSPEEVAYLLNVSPRTVRKWCVDGTIPAVKIGGVWRIPLLELEQRLGRMPNAGDA